MKNVLPKTWVDCLSIYLREVRQGLELSQDQAASQLGISRTALSKRETAFAQVTLWDVILFCDLADMPIFDFLDGVNAVAARHGIPQVRLKRNT